MVIFGGKKIYFVIKYENGFAALYKSSNDNLHGWKPGVKHNMYGCIGPDWILYAEPKNHLPEWW